MLQKEVVDRMAAAPGRKDFGRLTVMLQWRYEIEHLFDVPPEAFDPPPRVDSAVVRMQPRADAPAVDAKLLGDLSSGGTTITNVTILPAYVEMRVELVRALAPYPDARQAVARTQARRRTAGNGGATDPWRSVWCSFTLTPLSESPRQP
jgi:hypothetical protein